MQTETIWTTSKNGTSVQGVATIAQQRMPELYWIWRLSPRSTNVTKRRNGGIRYQWGLWRRQELETIDNDDPPLALAGAQPFIAYLPFRTHHYCLPGIVPSIYYEMSCPRMWSWRIRSTSHRTCYIVMSSKWITTTSDSLTQIMHTVNQIPVSTPLKNLQHFTIERAGFHQYWYYAYDKIEYLVTSIDAGMPMHVASTCLSSRIQLDAATT